MEMLFVASELKYFLSFFDKKQFVYSIYCYY
nr:MAG TPA: hypothetical protein [Caudoviricetes sp.]